MAESRTTTDHDVIRRWAEERGGRPAKVIGQEPIALRIDFPGEDDDGEELTPISWDEFFTAFEEKNLIFLYQQEVWLN